MSDGCPPLNDGETVLYDHVPSLRKFRKAALIAILITLIPSFVFSMVWPDTGAAVVPLLLSCAVLVQERFKLGRYRAWITNQRVILQGGEDAPLWDVSGVTPRLAGVRLDGIDVQLAYVADVQTLREVITTAQAKGDT